MLFHSVDSLKARGGGCYASFRTDESGRRRIKYFRSERQSHLGSTFGTLDSDFPPHTYELRLRLSLGSFTVSV
jgi:hypothetical protein